MKHVALIRLQDTTLRFSLIPLSNASRKTSSSPMGAAMVVHTKTKINSGTLPILSSLLDTTWNFSSNNSHPYAGPIQPKKVTMAIITDTQTAKKEILLRISYTVRTLRLFLNDK